MAKYQQQITNPYTNESLYITSNDLYLLEQKVNNKLALWEKQHDRDEKRLKKESLKEQAIEMTTQDNENIKSLSNILADTLEINDVLDWESLKDATLFRNYNPLPKPMIEDFLDIVPKPSFFEILPSVKQKRLDAENKAKSDYETKLKEWEIAEAENKRTYEKEKADYLEKQEKYNLSIENDKKLYERLELSGVEKYFSLVLENSKYPDFISLSYDIGFNSDQKLLIIDNKLPNFDDIQYIKEHKYISSRDLIEEVFYSSKEQERIYNSVIYQIILRTIHEVFESDYKANVDIVVVNGWVSVIDKKTGNDFNNCIATVQVTADEFKNIHLGKIEPVECFKHLKGKSAGSLINLAPVPPIMKLDKTDKRIISAESVLQTLDQSTNLASMDWQDFEVLIRDLLKHEFSNENCKVEVTRASRDAGVDAIAFDEDPIRGGKYVIQAKRYNNIVPLSAVRDLYGTVMNEGAVKGILVTTSYYGKDALEFVKDKPLKLINGEELVYMFNKYGYNMKIELAKKQKAQSKINY